MANVKSAIDKLIDNNDDDKNQRESICSLVNPRGHKVI